MGHTIELISTLNVGDNIVGAHYLQTHNFQHQRSTLVGYNICNEKKLVCIERLPTWGKEVDISQKGHDKCI